MGESAGQSFHSLCHSADKVTQEIECRLDDFINTYVNPHADQAREIQSLKSTNEALQLDIRIEERWLKQIAMDIIDSEEQAMIAALDSLWMLSQNWVNCLNIISSPSVPTLVAIMTSETNQSVLQASIGILGNLCGSERGRELFVNQYFGTTLHQLVERSKKILAESEFPSKFVQLTAILLFNLSLNEMGATVMLEEWIAQTYVTILTRQQYSENPNITDTIVMTLNALFGSRKPCHMMYLTYEIAAGLMEAMVGIPITSAIISLRTTVKSVFPGW